MITLLDLEAALIEESKCSTGPVTNLGLALLIKRTVRRKRELEFKNATLEPAKGYVKPGLLTLEDAVEFLRDNYHLDLATAHAVNKLIAYYDKTKK